MVTQTQDRLSPATNESGEGAAVKATGLWKVYGPKPESYMKAVADDPDFVDPKYFAAMRDVSFEVRPGETFVIMGLSGSGKSTLVRCLTRLLEPTAGNVEVDGRSMTAMNHNELREFRRSTAAMVFQHFGLLPHRRVLENVAYGLEIAGVARSVREARAEEVIDLVGLSGTGKKFPAELSGGMKQRVGLARALVMKPRLMLLDEPFSALDPLIRRDLQDELLRLATVMRQTSVFITHDLSEALKLGDRIAVMRAGKLVQVGTPEDIVLRPADDYVRRFAEDAPRSKVLRAETVGTLPLTLSETESVETALTKLHGNQCPYAFVRDEVGVPLGVVTTEELLIHRTPGRRVADIMQKDFKTVGLDVTLDDFIRDLAVSSSPIAVVDHRGRLNGGIDRGAALSALAQTGAGS